MLVSPRGLNRAIGDSVAKVKTGKFERSLEIAAINSTKFSRMKDSSFQILAEKAFELFVSLFSTQRVVYFGNFSHFTRRYPRDQTDVT